MTRRAILFDLDGTLLDSIELLLRCMEHAFATRSRRPSRAEWTAGIGTPLRTQLAPWCADEADIDGLVQRYREYQDGHLEALTSLYPGVAETLAWVRAAGHATGIVTSKGRIMTARSLRHVGLEGTFDTLVTYEETERAKPHPDPVWLALERLGVPATHALFIGDSPHDMAAGRDAGVQTAAALWGPFTREQLAPMKPTHWMDRMETLPAILAAQTPTGPLSPHAPS